MPDNAKDYQQIALAIASAELLDAVRSKGRELTFAVPNSEEYRYLQLQGVEAAAGGPDLLHILTRENPTRLAVLEEFLHGTQKRIGLIDKVGSEVAEVRVKDFMIRHSRMLGLADNEVTVLEVLKRQEAHYALRRGFSSELFRLAKYE